MTRAQWRKHIALPCFEDIGRWKLERYPQAWGYQWLHWCINFPLICFSSSVYAFILRILSTQSYTNYVRRDWYPLITLVWIRLHVKFPYFIQTLTEKIFYIVGKGKFRGLYYYGHSVLDCGPHGRSSKKINFSLWRHKQKENWTKPLAIFWDVS